MEKPTVLSIYGSPHHEGVSSRAHDLFLARVKDAGITVEKIYAYDAHIQPCTDCGVCSSEPRCMHDDDMTIIYDLLDRVQGITISSPVYFSSLPGPLKNIVDRCQLIWEKQRRKPVAGTVMAGFFIATAGSDYPGVFKQSTTVIRHLYNTLGCSFDESDFGLIPDVDTTVDIGKKMSDEIEKRATRFLSALSVFSRV